MFLLLYDAKGRPLLDDPLHSGGAAKGVGAASMQTAPLEMRFTATLFEVVTTYMQVVRIIVARCHIYEGLRHRKEG